MKKLIKEFSISLLIIVTMFTLFFFITGPTFQDEEWREYESHLSQRERLLTFGSLECLDLEEYGKKVRSKLLDTTFNIDNRVQKEYWFYNNPFCFTEEDILIVFATAGVIVYNGMFKRNGLLYLPYYEDGKAMSLGFLIIRNDECFVFGVERNCVYKKDYKGFNFMIFPFKHEETGKFGFHPYY